MSDKSPQRERESSAAAWSSVLKVAGATAAFALVHSLLASRTAKEATARVLGSRRRNAVYRPFYLAQTAVTLGMLWRYVAPLPDRELYRVKGPVALLMHTGQAVGFVHLLSAIHHIGLARVIGIPGLAAWLQGQKNVPPEPEAQGPALDADGTLRVAGPFVWSRHPLNFAPLPIIWLWPRMTARLAAFNVVATVYFMVGSIHEEKRLHAAYGEAYEQYQQSGCPFYFPRPRKPHSLP